MSNQLFTHRPPSTGIHLLTDPLPERVESPASSSAVSKPPTAKKQRPRRPKSG